MKLLKEIDREYATMTRKNKCIPSTRKKISRGSKKETRQTKKTNNSRSVRFNEPMEPVEPEPEPVEVSQENPFETEPIEEPAEEPVTEVNPVDDGLS